MSENAPFRVDESRRDPFRVQVTSRVADDGAGWVLFQFFCRDYAEAKPILEQLAADGWIIPPEPIAEAGPTSPIPDPATARPLVEVAGGGSGTHLLRSRDARPLRLRSRLLEFLFGRSEAPAQPHGPEEQRH